MALVVEASNSPVHALDLAMCSRDGLLRLELQCRRNGRDEFLSRPVLRVSNLEKVRYLEDYSGCLQTYKPIRSEIFSGIRKGCGPGRRAMGDVRARS